MNPASLMKFMSAKKKFTANHPKFAAFLKKVFSEELEEGTVLELTVTRPGQNPVKTNIRVRSSDLELLRELKEMVG
ncbi:MAG: hypothetical protein Q4C82_00925 [Eubacteriales bacterium]|nr:hypothetical protein [Eubacteriales bacterium]